MTSDTIQKSLFHRRDIELRRVRIPTIPYTQSDRRHELRRFVLAPSVADLCIQLRNLLGSRDLASGMRNGTRAPSLRRAAPRIFHLMAVHERTLKKFRRNGPQCSSRPRTDRGPIPSVSSRLRFGARLSARADVASGINHSSRRSGNDQHRSGSADPQCVPVIVRKPGSALADRVST